MQSNKSSKNIFFNTLLTVCQFIFPLITFPYLARILKPDGLGTINFLDNVVQYLIFMVGLGIPIYGIREIAKSRNNHVDSQKVFNELLVINIVSSLIILLVYSIILIIFKEKIAYLPFYFLIGFVVFLNVFNVEWLFQGLEEFSYITKRSIAVKSIAIVLTFIFIKKEKDIIYYYLIMIVSYLINSVINLNYATSKFNYKINFIPRFIDLKKHLTPIFLIFSANLAISIFLYFDSFILGLLSGNKAVGLYTTAIKLVKIPVMIIVAFINALVPSIAFSVKNSEFEAVRMLIKKSYDYVIFMSIPIVIGIFLTADFLVYILAGKEYADAVLTLRIMCPVIFSLAMTNIFVWQILTPFSKERFFLITVIIGMVVSIAMNYFLIPLLNQNGTAISTLVTESVICITSFFFSKKVFKFQLNTKILFQSLISCIPMILSYYLFKYLITDLILRSAIFIFCSIAFYLIVQTLFFKNKILNEFIFKS